MLAAALRPRKLHQPAATSFQQSGALGGAPSSLTRIVASSTAAVAVANSDAANVPTPADPVPVAAAAATVVPSPAAVSSVSAAVAHAPIVAAPVLFAGAAASAAASAATAAAAAVSVSSVTTSSPQLRDISLREISPGDDNHCFFNAVSQALGGKTPDQLRQLLRQGLGKLDSVHLLARYDLFREEGVDRRVVQKPNETADAFSKRQQHQLRQFQASYTRRSVYTDLSMGGTPEMCLLSHALNGGIVFLVYSGVRGEAPHVISSIHALSEEQQHAVKSGADGSFVGAGSMWPPPRARFPPDTVQICLLHGAYRGLQDAPNHWDLFHFYADGRSQMALPCWPHYERESDEHEQSRRSKIERMVDRIRMLQEQARQLRAFAAQYDLSAASKRLVFRAHNYQARSEPFLQPFPCGETTWMEGDDALESAFELRMSSIAPDCLGVFAIRPLEPEANSGVLLAYPSVIMTKRTHDRMMHEGLDPHTGVAFQFADENQADHTLMRQIFEGFTAVGQPLRKGVLINSVNTTGAASGRQNCRLMQMNDEELTSVSGFKPARGPICERTVYVTLIRRVVAGEELLLNYGTDYWKRHPVGSHNS